MSVPQKSTVQSIMVKYRKHVVDIVCGAWDDWLSSPHLGSWTKRGRANFVWEQMIDRALTKFNGLPEMHISSNHETYSFHVISASSMIVFRFKKGNTTGLSANIPTQSSLAFHNHSQPNLPGIPSGQRIEVVYILDKLETMISDILVVGRDKNVVVWTYSLLKSAPSVPLPAPSVAAPPTALPTTPSRPLVRPRGPQPVPDESTNQNTGS